MIGIEAYRTGASFLRRNSVIEIGRPILRRLMQDSGETANLAVPDGAEVVFVGQVETLNPIRAFFPPSARTPMYASGPGLTAMNPDAAGKALGSVESERFTDHTLIPGPDLTAELEKTRTRGGPMTTKTGTRACPVSAPPFTTTGLNPAPGYPSLARQSVSTPIGHRNSVLWSRMLRRRLRISAAGSYPVQKADTYLRGTRGMRDCDSLYLCSGWGGWPWVRLQKAVPPRFSQSGMHRIRPITNPPVCAQ